MTGSTSPSAANHAEALASAGRYREAASVLTQAAASGDSDALFSLAEWRIDGSIVRRDLQAARNLMARAGKAGHIDAALYHAYFLANGVGGSEDWKLASAAIHALARYDHRAKQQSAILRRMTLDEDGRPQILASREVLRQEPAVAASHGFLSQAECDYVRFQAERRLEPSLVVHPMTGAMIPHPIRKSHGAAFGLLDEDLVVSAINKRIAALSRTVTQQGEPLQVFKYFQGGEFRAHHDATPGAKNPRIATVLLYLNHDYNGGETHFLNGGLKFKGRTGDALLFDNLDDQGRPHPLAEHAGLPVTRGAKVIASRWIHQDRFVFSDPTPALAI